MSEARLPSIACGNGRLLLTLDSDGEVLSACWPDIDSPNQLSLFSIRPLSAPTSQASQTLNSPLYIEDTNISDSQSQTGLRFTDLVIDGDVNGSQIDCFVRRVSGPHPVIRLLVQPSMDGRPGSQTVYWDEQSQTMFAYCRQHWMAIGSSSARINDFHCGRLNSPSAASRWVDAQSLPGERIAFRDVDAILEFKPAADDTIVFTVFGPSREAVLTSLRNIRDKPWISFQQLAEQRAAKALNESRLQGWTPAVTSMLRRSSLVWDLLTNRTTGGIIAGPDVQSGIASAPGYAAFWARDGGWTLLGTLAMGQYELSKMITDFAWAVQSPEGLWLHRHHTDYSLAASWGLHQIDETGIMLYCFEKYVAATADVTSVIKYRPQVEKAANFLAQNRDPETGLPIPSVDLWEEREGFHLYTAASTIAGLRAAATLLAELPESKTSVEYWTSVADHMLQQTLTYFWDAKNGRFLSSLENSAALPMFDPERPELSANCQTSRPSTAIPQYPNWRDQHVEAVVRTHDISTIALAVPFGILDPTDHRIVATVGSLRECLWNKRIGGLHRYEGDSYGGGNVWPLATLWLAIYEAARGRKEEAKQMVQWVIDHLTPATLVPEQVHRINGLPIAAVPLSWSHAMVAIAVAACDEDERWLNQ